MDSVVCAARRARNWSGERVERHGASRSSPGDPGDVDGAQRLGAADPREPAAAPEARGGPGEVEVQGRPRVRWFYLLEEFRLSIVKPTLQGNMLGRTQSQCSYWPLLSCDANAPWSPSFGWCLCSLGRGS